VKIEIRNYRSCKGLGESDPFSCTLYLDGKRAAHVQNDGNGGCYRFDWMPADGRVHDGPTAKQFYAYVDALPEEDCYGTMLKPSADMVVGRAIDAMLADKQVRGWCRTAIVFRLRGDEPGAWRTIRAPYRPAIAAALRAEHGAKLEEIANERFLAVAQPAPRAGA
jgi:hypothetical protein